MGVGTEGEVDNTLVTYRVSLSQNAFRVKHGPGICPVMRATQHLEHSLKPLGFNNINSESAQMTLNGSNGFFCCHITAEK